MTKAQEQLDRIKRWYKRFEEINIGREHTRESDFYNDIVYAFFQNCWMLRDWMVNSKALDKKLIDDFFHSDKDMMICRDLANGSKHLVINKPSIDPNISINRREYSVSLGGEIPKIEVRYWIQVESHPPIDAFGLAGACLDKCEVFLLSNDF